MALQSDAIASRLESLKLDDRRMMFDSKIRAFRDDSQPTPIPGDRAPRVTSRAEPDQLMEQVISLLEELSRRIDGVEKKQRHLGDDFRHRARRDRRWRSAFVTVGLAVPGLLVVRWVLHWF